MWREKKLYQSKGGGGRKGMGEVERVEEGGTVVRERREEIRW